MNPPNPFARAHIRFREGKRHFEAFSDQATFSYVFALAQGEIPRFSFLHDMFTFFRFPGAPDAVQWDFGSRATSRRALCGGILAEKGGTLSYTLLPTGDVAVLLYPARSKAHRAAEDALVLRVGYYDSAELLLFLQNDLEDLVAYVYVTSLDRGATLGEKLRVRWLRWTKRAIKNGVTADAPASEIGASLTRSGIKAGVGLVWKFLVPALLVCVIGVLVWLGYTEAALKLQSIFK